jgi:hypothetical protein
MTIVDDMLVVFALLMVCAFCLTADRKITDDLEREECDRADAPDRTCARNGGREFWLEIEGGCGSNRSA